jgi:hypothetical protein
MNSREAAAAAAKRIVSTLSKLIVYLVYAGLCANLLSGSGQRHVTEHRENGNEHPRSVKFRGFMLRWLLRTQIREFICRPVSSSGGKSVLSLSRERYLVCVFGNKFLLLNKKYHWMNFPSNYNIVMKWKILTRTRGILQVTSCSTYDQISVVWRRWLNLTLDCSRLESA